MRIQPFLFAALLAAPALLADPRPGPPADGAKIAHARRVERAPRIDGELDDPAWSRAAWLNGGRGLGTSLLASSSR